MDNGVRDIEIQIYSHVAIHTITKIKFIMDSDTVLEQYRAKKLNNI